MLVSQPAVAQVYHCNLPLVSWGGSSTSPSGTNSTILVTRTRAIPTRLHGHLLGQGVRDLLQTRAASSASEAALAVVGSCSRS